MTGFWQPAPPGRRAWPGPARRRSAVWLAVWLAVLLGHGLLALGLAGALRPLAPASTGAAAQALLWLRLAPQPAAPPRPAGMAPRPPGRGVPNRALPDARTVRASPPEAAPTPTQASSLAAGADGADGADGAAGAAGADAASRAIDAARAPERPASQPPQTPPAPPARTAQPTTAQPTTAPAPAALNLALPRPAAARHSATAAAQVHDDARLGGRLSRDQRLAQALGSDQALHEDQRGAVRRFRQGRACVDMAPAREAQINPFNQTASPTPRQATPC